LAAEAADLEAEDSVGGAADSAEDEEGLEGGEAAGRAATARFSAIERIEGGKESMDKHHSRWRIQR
jgi:hypothetical protein